MKKYVWTQAALLLTLPLCGAWYFWHGYALIAVSLVAAAFAVIVGSQIGARPEIRRKQQQLEGTAKKDGRYLTASWRSQHRSRRVVKNRWRLTGAFFGPAVAEEALSRMPFGQYEQIGYPVWRSTRNSAIWVP